MHPRDEGNQTAEEKRTEDLRSQLLDDVYAGAAAGMPELLLDEDRIRSGNREELQRLAREHGMG